MAQLFPLPGSDKVAPVVCTGCPGLNVHQQPNANLNTVPFSGPILRHVGRLVDSTSTQAVQSTAFRTARSGQIRTARDQRGSAPPRIYIRIGEAVFAYSLSTFFSSTLPGGMQPINKLDTGRAYGLRNPFEKVAMPDAFIYPEAVGSGWILRAGDEQNTYGDHDFDDRGYIYAAFSSHGWALIRDTGANARALLQPAFEPIPEGSTSPMSPVNPEVIVALKSGSSYYALICDARANRAVIYDVTNPANPVLLPVREGAQWGVAAADSGASWSKSADGDRFAYVGGDLKIRVFDTATYLTGGSPLAVVTPNPGRIIRDVVFDESGNLWMAEGTTTATANVLRRLRRTGNSYTESALDVYGEAFSPEKIDAADGYVMLSGYAKGVDGLDSLDAKLFKVEGNNLREVELGKFFSKYYHRAPRGYAQPQAYPNNYSAVAMDVQVIKWAGKVYIIYSSYGIGDVFEIESGGSVSVSKKATFGTPNPNSKSTELGPYYGDVVTFNASSSVPSSSGLAWDFGNPESGTSKNLGNSSNGSDIIHQYTGISSAAAITAAKTVTATDITDPQVSGTLAVTLKLPKLRVGLPDGTTVTAAASGVEVAAGDSFTDASDGSVQSHVATWTLDGGTPVNELPSAAAGV